MSVSKTQLDAIAAAAAAQAGDLVAWRAPAATYDGRAVETHEVFALAGLANDPKLLRSRLCEPLGARERVQCGDCGRAFLTPEQAVAHMLRVHPADAETDPAKGADSNAPRSASSERGAA